MRKAFKSILEHKVQITLLLMFIVYFIAKYNK